MHYLLGKRFPTLDAWKRKEDRLRIVISYGNKEQFIDVPRLKSSSGSEHAQPVLNAIVDWNLEERVQIIR